MNQLQCMDLNWIMSQINCKTIKDNQENVNTGWCLMIWGVVGEIEFKHDWSWFGNVEDGWWVAIESLYSPVYFCICLEFSIINDCFRKPTLDREIWLLSSLCIPATTILTFPEANECSETTCRIVLEKSNWHISKNIIPILEYLFLVENAKFRITCVEFEIPSSSRSWKFRTPTWETHQGRR